MQKAKKLIRKAVPKKGVVAAEKIFRKGRGLFWMTRYGFPAKNTKVVAVTGTNGKSTTSAFINEILKSAGYRTAMMTTPMMEINAKSYPRTTTRTLEKQSEVQNFFHKAKKAEVDWVVLEVPSHALDQDRILGVKIEVAVITNLTPEHLDYHGTMEEYARAKARIARNYSAKTVILNSDDEWYEYFNDHSVAEVFSVGKVQANSAQIKSIKIAAAGSEAVLESNDQKVALKTKLIGEFNLYNAAQAAAVGIVLDISSDDINRGVSNLKAVSGRLESVKEGQKFSVFVDYAVTPDAIENVLKTLQKFTKGKVRIVFGATGDRDKQKRPLMGEVAGKNADAIYLTDDETYNENSQDIIDEVYEGIKKVKATKKTKVIPDREAAIQQAINDARPDDTILVTGLGHETSRNMSGKQLPWSDRETIKNIIKHIKIELNT